jgi:phospholipase C
MPSCIKSVTPNTQESVRLVTNDSIKWVQDNAMDHLVHATELYHDLEGGALPSFSYLNPECCTVDSMHPTSSMAAGEQMVKHLYDALRRSKYWDNASGSSSSC